MEVKLGQRREKLKTLKSCELLSLSNEDILPRYMAGITWEDRLFSTSYMAGATWDDRLSSEKVAKMFGMTVTYIYIMIQRSLQRVGRWRTEC